MSGFGRSLKVGSSASLNLELGIVMEKILLTIEEAAKVLSLSRSTIYREMESGRLLSVKVGNSRRIPQQSLTQYVNFIIRDERESRATK